MGDRPARVTRWMLPLGAALGLLVSRHAAAEVSAFPARIPSLRLRMGPSVPLTQRAEEPRGTPFALDLALGYPTWFLIGGHRNPLLLPFLVLYPEMSYSYQIGARHLFTTGMYVGLGAAGVFASYGARYVIGTEREQRALGLRHGVGLHFLADIVSIEVNHQPLWVHGGVQHDLQVWFAINPLSAVGLLMRF